MAKWTYDCDIWLATVAACVVGVVFFAMFIATVCRLLS